MYVPNLYALFVKFAGGQFCKVAASICHEGELDAKREMSERLKLVVPGWYDLLALFAAVAQERCIVSDQNNHGHFVAKLRQNLLDQSRIGLVEGDVDAGERFVRRREIPCRGELALCIWVRQFQTVLRPLFVRQSLGFFFGTAWNDGIDASITTHGNLSSRNIVFCGANDVGSSSDPIVKSIVSESLLSSKNKCVPQHAANERIRFA